MRDPLSLTSVFSWFIVFMMVGGATGGKEIQVAQDFADVALRLGLTEEDLKEAGALMGDVSVIPETLALAAQR